jgi:hypothetical protein
MPQPIRHTITRQKDGKYIVARESNSGGIALLHNFERDELLIEGKITGSTLEDVMSDLDRTGRADVLLRE